MVVTMTKQIRLPKVKEMLGIQEKPLYIIPVGRT
jgi:hypothetical protein